MINLSMAEPDNMLRPRITVVGVGGGGCNAINNMIRSNLEGCDFVAANTDAQALAMSLASRKLQLGINLSRGLGAGSRPEIGQAAAEEQIVDIIALLEGSDMLFVTAGMGGGTGTGAAPVIARAARESGILTVGVVTKPFHFEGAHRMRQAEQGIAELQQYVDTLIVIPNQNLFRIANERTTFAEAFRMADDVLHSGVRGITDLMIMPGFMNLDFADVKTVMGEMGKAMMGTGEAEGDNRAIRAAEAAISNPLLDDISMKGARGVLINITGGLDMTLFEMDQAANRIREEVDPDAQIKVGSTLGENLEGRIRVSVIATGIDATPGENAETAASGRGDASGARPQQQTAAPAPQRIVTSSSTAAPMATQTAPQTKRPVVGQASMQNAAPVYAQPAAPVAQTPAPSFVQAGPQQQTSNVDLSSSYFAMPPAVTPEMVAQHQTPVATPVQSEPQTTVAQPSMDTVRVIAEDRPTQAPMTAVQVENDRTPYATATAGGRSPYATAPAQQVRSTVVPPASPAPVRAPSQPAGNPVDPSMMERGGPRDMRVTQLTTAAPAQNAPAAHVNHRSQSLFQRITGFGLVRPSSRRREEMEDENELDFDMTTTQQTPEELGVDPADRPVLSSPDKEVDNLEIPAFLRRQTNH